VCLTIFVEDHEDGDDWGEVSGPAWTQDPDNRCAVGSFGNDLDPASAYQGVLRQAGQVTIRVDTTGYENLVMSFQSSGSNLDAGERFFFEVSYLGGLSWETVFAGVDHPWTDSSFDLSAFSAGASDDNPNFMIRFRIGANSPSERFYLDNIVLTGCMLSGSGKPAPLAAVSPAEGIAAAPISVGATSGLEPLPASVVGLDSAETASTAQWRTMPEAPLPGVGSPDLPKAPVLNTGPEGLAAQPVDEGSLGSARRKAAGGEMLTGAAPAGKPTVGEEVYLFNDSWQRQPSSGDWAGIILESAGLGTMENCIVEYARSGVEVVNAAVGTVDLRASAIRANWIGVLCRDGFATVNGCTFAGQVISPDAPPLPGSGANATGSGLVCILGARPLVGNCIFGGNEGNDVGILDGALPDLGRIGNPASPGRNRFLQPREGYAIFNGTVNTIYAQMNIFDLLPGEGVEDTLYDDTDDASRGPVIWAPVGADLTGVGTAVWETYR